MFWLSLCDDEVESFVSRAMVGCTLVDLPLSVFFTTTGCEEHVLFVVCLFVCLFVCLL